MSEQARLFDPERYSPARVSAFLRLPESNARSFAIASAIGSILDGDGTTNTLRSAKQATGVLITRKRIPAVLDALGILERRWRALVDDWTVRQVAHRCRPGVVVLFTMPFLEECPSCNGVVEATRLPLPARAKPRGRSYGTNATKRTGSSSAAETAVVVPPSGADSAAAPAQRVPLLRTNAPHHKTGLLTRDEQGLGLEGSSIEEDSPPAGGEVRNRAERCECGAKSSEPGYWGHANGCRRFYGEEP
jgi:hypothetical protein